MVSVMSSYVTYFTNLKNALLSHETCCLHRLQYQQQQKHHNNVTHSTLTPQQHITTRVIFFWRWHHHHHHHLYPSIRMREVETSPTFSHLLSPTSIILLLTKVGGNFISYPVVSLFVLLPLLDIYWSRSWDLVSVGFKLLFSLHLGSFYWYATKLK